MKLILLIPQPISQIELWLDSYLDVLFHFVGKFITMAY
jgi:hypothetical protein